MTTTITDTFRSPAGIGVAGVAVRATLVAASEVLTGGGAIIREAETVTAADGTWSLALTPIASLAVSGGAYYLIAADGHRWTIDVPSTGGPYSLGAVMVVPGALAALGGSGVPPTRQVIAGAGLTGGGDLSVDRTLSANVGTAAGTVAAGDDARINGAAQKAANLSDLASAATARSSLGLGGAALLPVGTAAGTVAAGDDSRFALPAPATGTDFTLFVDRAGAKPRYYAKDRTGIIVADYTDTATTSGLKAVFTFLFPPGTDGVSLHLTKGRFHYLDAPLGTETWSAVEDHYAWSQCNRITIEGEGPESILSNYTNDAAVGGTDTEPLSLTRVEGWTLRNFQLESCGRAKSTSDALDGDEMVDSLIDNVRITSSRAKAITIDGGYPGRWSGRNIVRNCQIHGRPEAPVSVAVAGGTLAVQTYTYAVAWRCNGLGVFAGVTGTSAGTTATLTVTGHSYAVGDTVNITGMSVAGYNGTWTVASVPDANTVTVTTATASMAAASGGTAVGPDVTKPSDGTDVVTATGSQKVRVYLKAGPYSCVGRRIYRHDGIDWKTVATVADNTTLTYDDDGTGTPPAATFTAKSTIPDIGIELMASRNNIVMGNIIDGVGDTVNGASQYGIGIVRKVVGAVTVGADGNLIIGNVVRQTGSHAVRIAGGSDNIVTANHISNPGVVATKANALRIEGLTGVASDRNQIYGNTTMDDQTAASPSGGVSTSNALAITATNNPNGNIIGPNSYVGYSSSSAISDAGTGTQIEADEKTLVLLVDGSLVVGTTAKGFTFACPWPGVIKRARLYAGTAPTGAAILVDINVNGVTIWATQSNRVTVAAGANSGTQASFNTTAVAAGDLITVDVDQVGSTVAGANLTVELTILASRVY